MTYTGPIHVAYTKHCMTHTCMLTCMSKTTGIYNIYVVMYADMRLVLRHHAHLHCLHCLFFRWRSWYCCAGRLALPSVTRRARPEPFSTQTRCLKVQNSTAGLARVLWPYISHLHPLRKIELKNQPNPSINKKVRFLTLLESLKPKIFQTPLEISQKLCSSRNTCRIAGKKVVSSPPQDRQK